MNNDDVTTYKHILRLRGVDVPCSRCKGLGACMYGSGSTWRGGMGTSSCQADVCDICWGTGDKYRAGVDLRKLESYSAKKTSKECAEWLLRKTGLNWKSSRKSWKHLISRLDKEVNRRKFPEDINQTDYQSSVVCLKKTIESMIEGMENEEDIKDIIE